jgi:hypothetical protein
MCSIEQIQLGIKTTLNPVSQGSFDCRTGLRRKELAKLAVLVERLCCALNDRTKAAFALDGQTNR